MGKHKEENEELIKYGLDTDVWFHVDDLSSAHVYLRMKPNMTMDDISQDLILDCSALVKANSIAGCKVSVVVVETFIQSSQSGNGVSHNMFVYSLQQNSVYVVYTRWKNLKKTSNMVDGQVGFHRPDNVRRIQVEKNTSIVKQIEKTRKELHPDLARLQQDREREIIQQKKQHFKQELRKQEQERKQHEQEKEAKSYDRMFKQENMHNNREMKATSDEAAAEEYEDDFF